MPILTEAIRIQQEGERFYSDHAAKHSHSALKVVLNLLAEDEKRHAMLLTASRDKLPYELTDSGITQKVAELFYSMEVVKDDIPAPTEQVDIYHAAWQMEKKAAAQYEQLLNASEDPDDRALFAFLIDQEAMHARVMEELYRHVNRPNEWVENAEFGLREEY
ncbi:MAG: ferritin family protein [Clostridiales bacterium]|nr:ferritin family protein [Clostridiales bacterium]